MNVGTKGHIDHHSFDDSYLAVIQRFEKYITGQGFHAVDYKFTAAPKTNKTK